MRNIFVLILFFAGLNATATVEIIQVSGASNYIKTTSTTGTTTGVTHTAYGGTAGPYSNCSDNGDQTCNNCNLTAAGGPGFYGTICNERRLIPSGILTISARPSIAGILTIFNSTTNARINGASINNIPTGGTQGLVTVPWSQICSSFTTGNATCEFAGSAPFNIGIDKNANGIKDPDDDVVALTIIVNNAIGGQDYTVIKNAQVASDCLYPMTLQPGDEKVYLGPLPAVGTFPDSNLVPFFKYRVYISSAPIDANTDISTLSLADLDVTGTTSDYSISPDYVDGLENGIPHFFALAQVDKAYNVGYFTSPADNALLTATPDFVYGLLSQDFECFVATATYGTPDAKEVKTLRRFRNYLIQHHRSWAFPLVKFYYKHSPKLASFIRDNEILKTGSRIILWGPIQFAKISLQHGMAYAFMIFLLPVILLIAIYRWWNVKIARRT